LKARARLGRGTGTYHFLRLLDTSLELGDVALCLIFGEFIDLVLFDDTQRLLGV
jgi:hypothetical protein